MRRGKPFKGKVDCKHLGVVNRNVVIKSIAIVIIKERENLE
jgi:hypothetical protein